MMCLPRSTIALGMAVAVAAITIAPASAQHSHGRRRAASSTPTPADAGEAVCRTRARDFASEKHADVGQERMFFDKCMGR